MGSKMGKKKERKLGDLAKHIIYVEWLRQSVMVYDSAKDAEKDLALVDVKPYCASGGAGYAVGSDTGALIFWVILNERKPSIGLVVHEAIHCVDYLLEAVGIPVDVKTAEVRCYMVEWLTNEIIKRMRIKA